MGDVLLAEAGQDPPGVSWQGVKRAEGTPRRRTNTPAPPSARMDAVTAASSPGPRCAVPTSLCGSPLPLLVPSQALQQKPASPHREGPKARALRSCFAAPKDLGCFGSFPCRVQGFAPAAAGGSAGGAGCGVSGVAGGLPKIPAVSPRAAGLRRLQFASETGKEKREILQFSKWLRGEVEVAAQAGDGCGVQTSATPPTCKCPRTPPAPTCAKKSLQTRAGHEDPTDPSLAPSHPRGRGCPGRGGPERIPGCQVGAKSPLPEFGWPPASPHVPHASALQPSASPGCLPSQPHSHGPTSLAPQKARERSDEPGTGRHPWVPNTARLLPGHGGAPKPVLPAPKPLCPRPRPLHRFLPSPCPPTHRWGRRRGAGARRRAWRLAPPRRRAGGGRLWAWRGAAGSRPSGAPAPSLWEGRGLGSRRRVACACPPPLYPDEASGNEPGLRAGRGWGGPQRIELCTASDVGESFPPLPPQP